jgi:hypothetical protein
MLGRRMKPNGSSYPYVSLKKHKAIVLFITLNEQYMECRFKPLEVDDRALHELLRYSPHEIPDVNLDRIVVIDNTPVTSVEIQNLFDRDSHMPTTIVEAFMYLHRDRDSKLYDTTHELFSEKTNYRPRLRSFYFSPIAADQIFSDNVPLNAKMDLFPENLLEMNDLFIPMYCQYNLLEHEWILLQLNVVRCSFVIHRPKYEFQTTPEDLLFQDNQHKKWYAQLELIVNSKFPDVPIQNSMFKNTYTSAANTTRYPEMDIPNVPKDWCTIPTHKCSGVFILLAIDFLYFNVSFSWTYDEIDTSFRDQLVHSLLMEELNLFI